MRTPNATTLSLTHNGAMNIERPITVTIVTARKISGLGNTTIWKMIGDGTLETVQVGRRRLIVYESLLRLLTPTGHVVSTTGPGHRGRPRKSRKAVTP